MNKGVPPASSTSSPTARPPIISWPSSLALKYGGTGPVGFMNPPVAPPYSAAIASNSCARDIFPRRAQPCSRCPRQ
jgi:hypothetical protein